MKYKAVFYLLGFLCLMMSAFLLIPVLVTLLYREDFSVKPFLAASGLSAAMGLMIVLGFRRHQDEPLAIRDGFLLVALAWFSASFLGAIPFLLSGYFPSIIDAVFESVSGFTTTGATVLRDIEALPHALLFWRSFTQWIGGMGIIVLAIAILPQLSIGGMQLMKNEMPGPTFEHLKPRIKQTALSLWKIYLLFSVTQVLVLYYLGMPLFDSVCHMFSTMATGGFSTKNASLGAYQNTGIELTVAFFMLLAGMNFVLHYAWLRGNFKKIFQDSEWRFYMVFTLCGTLTVAASLWLGMGENLGRGFRLSIFQILSLMTTTGFTTADYDQWPHLAKSVLFMVMFVGGCAGSTGGGLKQVRIQLLLKQAHQSVVQHVFPKAVVTVKLNRKVVPESVLYAVSSFFLIYTVIFFVGNLLLYSLGMDFFSAGSAVIANLANVGPGFGEVGAAGNYAHLSTGIKIVLSALMIIGRLEIFTILVLFYPQTWKR